MTRDPETQRMEPGRDGIRSAKLLRYLLGRPQPSHPVGPPPAGGDGPPAEPGPLEVHEEIFGDGGAAFPEDLFGAGFRWEGAGSLRFAFLDLETCGLSDDPIFLAGILRPEGARFRLTRLLARDPSGEPALLRGAAAILGDAQVWVTFNGRSFDGPRLRRRAAHHGIEFPAPPEHRDLLLAVRRRWRGALPDCRLGTVERRLLDLERSPGDVPGREVPERYRDFVRTRDRRWIEPVLAHNRRDVAALAALHRRLEEEGEFPPVAG